MMKCSFALIVVLFLIGVNASDAVENKKTGNNAIKATPAKLKKPGSQNSGNVGKISTPVQNQSKNANAKGGYPTAFYDDTRLEQLKTEAAATNPMNFMVAVMSENENKLVQSARLLKVLRDKVLGQSFLGTFIDNMIDLIENIRSQTMDMMIHSFPKYFEKLMEVGQALSTVAESEEDQLAIFNANAFEEITTPEFSATREELAYAMFENFENVVPNSSPKPPNSGTNRTSKPRAYKKMTTSTDSN